ncbi:MAG: SAM-dependent methyltransferase [Rhodospirillales bacterium]|nr:SAM-dependent methyltransferase [Rhodospirillales bacterium]
MFIGLLKLIFKEGAFQLVDQKGSSYLIGDDTEPVCTLLLHKNLKKLSLIFNPTLRMPEEYMKGTLTIQGGNLYDFLDIASKNIRRFENSKCYRFLRCLNFASLGQYNPIRKARVNVAHHYDLSDKLYDIFLDSDRQYSCAYFTTNHTDLENAQLDKKHHIATKLRLEKGQKILDIGSGWGGLVLYLAQSADVNVKGITLSKEQYEISIKRAKEIKKSEKVSFELQDYRNENEIFDRIVSVGMFEHVGTRNYREFFEKINEILALNGVMVLHFIGRVDSPHSINPFIRKYIFPGADLPSLSQVLKAIEPTRLMVTDVEVLRLHYAKTLRLWREKFMEQWDEVAEIYDQKFCRMWEIYLALCEVGFRNLGLVVFQIQITKTIDAVPLTRDYMINPDPICKGSILK